MTPNLKRIAIVGGESTGKSTLAQHLAGQLGCLWVPEYARHYLEQTGPVYDKRAVEDMARGQLILEDALAVQAASLGHEWLVCDTTLLVIEVWMQHSYQHVPTWIEETNRTRNYHTTLLCAPDLPWEYDPLREHPDLREYFFLEYKRVLKKYGLEYVLVDGERKSWSYFWR